jgi:hypothetical protein
MGSAISLVWELPLAVASRLLFQITRFVLRRIARLHYRRAADDARRWRLLNADLLARRFALPVVMTEGPRWNTHATIGRVGPLSVRSSLEVQTSLADASARAWTIVVYTFPNHRTIATMGPADRCSGEDWTKIPLPPGRYSLILRYYKPSPQATLPTVRIDGQPSVDSMGVPEDTNAFYERLASRRNLFYVMLHYHAFFALKYRARLPRQMVERVYLPVGNPQTCFRYGALGPSDVLRVALAPAVLDACDAYVTVYDVGSFPVAWQEIESVGCRLGPFQRRCTFLIRLHRRLPAAPLPREDDVKLTIQPVGR